MEETPSPAEPELLPDVQLTPAERKLLVETFEKGGLSYMVGSAAYEKKANEVAQQLVAQGLGTYAVGVNAAGNNSLRLNSDGVALARYIIGNAQSPKVKDPAALAATKKAKKRKLSSRNVSGQTGVGWQEKSGKWIATIQVDKKPKYLGSFENLEDAIAARRQAEVEYYNKTQ
jgi:hypothetical protein